MVNALTDSLVRNDPKSQELAYNNTTDRMKVELPALSDPSSSGVISTPVDAAAFKGEYAHLGGYTVGNVIWTPELGKKYVVTDFMFNAVTHGTIKIYDGVGTEDHILMQFTVPSGSTIDHTFRKPYPSSAINTSLMADCHPGCSGYLAVWGYEI